jgi:hypothetical protein
MDVQSPRVGLFGKPPHASLEFVAAKRPPSGLAQALKQVKLSRRQHHLLIAHPNFVTRRIQTEIAESIGRFDGDGGVFLIAAQCRPQPGRQLACGDRLAYAIIGASGEDCNHIRLLSLVKHNYDWTTGATAQMATRLRKIAWHCGLVKHNERRLSDQRNNLRLPQIADSLNLAVRGKCAMTQGCFEFVELAQQQD